MPESSGKFFLVVLPVFKNSAGLRAHAILISIGLISLTALLGGRAYSVGRAHFLESRDLLERDVPAQKLLFQIESAQSALAQARKKLQITKDPAYSRLIAQARDALALRRAQLAALRPEMDSSADLKTLEKQIASEREQRVRHARDSAQGLVRLIGIAVSLSLLITAWLILLLYRGLMDPLKTLSQATQRVQAGDLTTRIDERGVAELRDLSRSFNSMASRLESLDRAKREFLTMISHELRNPMAALKEGLALLSSEEKSLSEESRKRCLSACVIASKRLEHMINNLLSLSRDEPGVEEQPFRYELARNYLASAIHSSVAEVRPLADKKGMQILVNCPQELVFAFNREGMVQAFVNLLLNAIKYGAEGSAIEITAEQDSAAEKSRDGGPMIRISVSNSGKEIPSRELDHIFEAFYRGENSSKQQGMGIGLHVVKRVVDAHRGFVSAVSAAGRTRMIVTLPLLFLLGCSLPTSRLAPPPLAVPPVPQAAQAQSSAPSAHPFQSTATTRWIERKLRHAKGDQILVSRKLLERLLRETRTDRVACNRVNGQLEALKKVDVDGPHPFDR